MSHNFFKQQQRIVLVVFINPVGVCSRSCSSHPYSVRSRACARRTLMRSARRRGAQLGKQSQQQSTHTHARTHVHAHRRISTVFARVRIMRKKLVTKTHEDHGVIRVTRGRERVKSATFCVRSRTIYLTIIGLTGFSRNSKSVTEIYTARSQYAETLTSAAINRVY